MKAPHQFQKKGDQRQHHYHRDGPRSSREPGHYDQYRPPPHRHFEREGWRQDQQRLVGQSSEAKGHDRKKKHHRGKRQLSCEPQPSPGPISLFPDHNGYPSAEGPTPIPLFPDRDQIQSKHDQIDDYYGQNSSETCERANVKHRKRNKGRHKRKKHPYESPTFVPSRTGSGSSELDASLTNDSSYAAGRSSYPSDCMEPEGLSSRSPHSRGRARREEERGHHSMMEVDQSPSHDWSHQAWSHYPAGAGYGPGDRYYESYGDSYSRPDPYHWHP